MIIVIHVSHKQILTLKEVTVIVKLTSPSNQSSSSYIVEIKNTPPLKQKMWLLNRDKKRKEITLLYGNSLLPKHNNIGELKNLNTENSF